MNVLVKIPEHLKKQEINIELFMLPFVMVLFSVIMGGMSYRWRFSTISNGCHERL